MAATGTRNMIADVTGILVGQDEDRLLPGEVAPALCAGAAALARGNNLNAALPSSRDAAWLALCAGGGDGA